MYAKPLSSWYIKPRISSGSSPSGDFYNTYRRLFWTYSKTRYTIPFLRNAYFNSTMFAWCSIFKILTSLIVVFFTISSSSVYLNFLIAASSPFSLLRHLRTTPYAPYPIMPRISYFCINYIVKASIEIIGIIGKAHKQ
jgi:hypothetical protein